MFILLIILLKHCTSVTCTLSDLCTSCLSSSECTAFGCSWNSTSSLCALTEECDGDQTGCYEKNIFCYYNGSSCKSTNATADATCNSSAACASCLSSYDCTTRNIACSWNTDTHTCTNLNCEQYTVEAECTTDGAAICRAGNYCSWNGTAGGSVCFDNGCSHGTYCLLNSSMCHFSNNCVWNTELQICHYIGGSSSCLSASTSCTACRSERLCAGKSPVCVWSVASSMCSNSSSIPPCGFSSACVDCAFSNDCAANEPRCTWNDTALSCESAGPEENNSRDSNNGNNSSNHNDSIDNSDNNINAPAAVKMEGLLLFVVIFIPVLFTFIFVTIIICVICCISKKNISKNVAAQVEPKPGPQVFQNGYAFSFPPQPQYVQPQYALPYAYPPGLGYQPTYTDPPGLDFQPQYPPPPESYPPESPHAEVHMEESSRSVSGVGGEAGAAVQVEYPAAAAARAADEGGSAKKGGVEGADLGTEEKVERKAHKTASKGSLRKTHGSKGSWD